MGTYFKYNDLNTNLHHIFGIIGMMYIYLTGKYGNGFSYGMFYLELSTPFIKFNKILELYNIYPKTRIIFFLIFSAIFVYARTYIMYCIINYIDKEYMSLLFLFLLGLNWHVSVNWMLIIAYKILSLIADFLNLNYLKLALLNWKKIRNSLYYFIPIHSLIVYFCFNNIFKGLYKEII